MATWSINQNFEKYHQASLFERDAALHNEIALINSTIQERRRMPDCMREYILHLR